MQLSNWESLEPASGITAIQKELASKSVEEGKEEQLTCGSPFGKGPWNGFFARFTSLTLAIKNDLAAFTDDATPKSQGGSQGPMRKGHGPEV